MKEHIKEHITQALTSIFPKQVEDDFSIEFAPVDVDADFASNVGLVLSKKIGKKPIEIAGTLAQQLAPKFEDQYEISIAEPGFLNFTLKKEVLEKNIKAILTNPKHYGASDLGVSKLALVEYFQLNVAKPPHVGHLRSAVIGDSIKRILSFVGYKTISDTHIGDWGTQFGLLLLAYKTLGGEERVGDNPLEELNELYIEINKKIEEDPSLREKGKQEFVKLEQGDEENRKLWKFFVEVSRKKFDEMVEVLELLPFDYDLGESFYEDHMRAMVQKLDDQGLLTTGETGEKYIDLEQYGLGRLICVKSDGGTTYELRDLATFAYRYDELSKKQQAALAWNLYVVDARQSHDFRQVFKVMGLLGYDVAHSRHVEFGFLTLPEGAMSTRKGNTISLERLIQEATNRARAIIEDKNEALKNKDAVARAVGLAAIKYTDLKHNRKSDIVFDWDEAVNFEGHTGPYIQYTYARLKSIIRKSDLKKIPDTYSTDELSDIEMLIVRKLAFFPQIIQDAAFDFTPSTIASYVYELAALVNTFYQSIPVLQETDEKKRDNRLALVAASAIVLKKGLYLLGISAPEEM